MLARSDARFCSSRCRVAAHRAVPPELRKRPRWVRYSKRKVPLTVTGAPASSTNPETWSAHRDAERSTAGVGLGFVLNGDGIVCLDLDKCLVDGKPTSAARRLLKQLPPTFTEVSPSGRGLHVWGHGFVPHGRRLTVDDVQVEVYGTGRYITMTGRSLGPSRLADLSGFIDSLT